MAIDSFGEFLSILDKRGELTQISTTIATELEITEIADREMKKPDGGKALLFNSPSINGSASSLSLAINTMGSHRRMAIALGRGSVDEAARDLESIMHAKPPASFTEAIKLLGSALELRHAKPKQVSNGACKEIIEDPRDFSGNSAELPTLSNLPIQKCWPKDGGRFITLPCVVTQDPDTGARNVGMYRMQVFDSQTTGMHWQLQKVAARHGKQYYNQGKRMPVSVFLGGDPVYPFCATAPLPDGLDEFLLAGYLRGKSVPLIKCETNDLQVPANADIVIEGYVDPTEELRDEGPFGDHTGYYTLPDKYPAFHITTITRRSDAVYPSTIVGQPPMEDFYMGSASVKIFMPIFRMNFPEIIDIALPAEGVFHNLVFVSIKKTYPMQAYKIMHGLWGMGQMMFSKYIVVVDDDVDVHNTSEVLFRIGANTDPQRDTVFTRGPSDVLDHATPEVAMGSKMGIDATKKLSGEGFKREWPPIIKMDKTIQNKVDEILGK